MNKLFFKLLLVICFITTAFFTTGCNNGDDYDSWIRHVESDSLLLRIAIPELVNSERAVSNPKTIFVAGVQFTFEENRSGLDYYYAYIARNILNTVLKALKFQINNTVFYIDSNFFKTAINSASSGNQPNAVITFDAAYNVIKAESNGISTEIPTKWTENPDEDPTVSGVVNLSISGDTVTAVVPSEFGNVTSLYSWELKLSSTSGKNVKSLYSGQYQEMYTISSNGNNFYFTLTETGKANLKSNTTYVGYLDSVVVYTDKYGDTPLRLTSNNTIYYRK